MKEFVPYLIFDGNSRDVINFYRNCFGGEILRYSYHDYKLTKNESESIIYSKLKVNGKTLLIISDGCQSCKDYLGENEYQCGDSLRYSAKVQSKDVVISIDCESANEFTTYYDNLALGGEIVTSPDEYSGIEMYGKVKDKFGIHWALNFVPEIDAK